MSVITLYTRNILETGTVTVTGTPDTGYPESRLYDRAFSLFWKDSATEAKIVHVDQGASGNLAVDFLAIERHNFDGEDMQWQYSTDDFSADINDAVTDWAQSGSARIVKVLGSALTKRYWRVTVGVGTSPSSLANPKCSEVFMSFGRDFEAQVRGMPRMIKTSNVRWNRTMGNVERSIKRGDLRRQRRYELLLDSTDLTAFEAAMDEIDEYSLPFYIKDHDGDYWPCRLVADPDMNYDHDISMTRIVFEVIEQL
jgi:hypothetical protein